MYKAPLTIYVAYHPKCKEGQKLADAIYSYYSRNINEPLSRGIGIPVYFRSDSYYNDLPIDIQLNESENNAVVLLIDDNAIVYWKDYVESLRLGITKDKSGISRLFPVSLSGNFQNIGKKMADLNFIRLHTGKDFKSKKDILFNQLTHEFCRMLLNKPRISKSIKKSKLSPAPVDLFISHAKKDGTNIAQKIKSYTEQTTPIKTFFDTIDIATGYKFESEIDASIESAALLVIQTDSYSSREWCRWEILKAKRIGRPVVVVNAIEEGEERSFPYLGNVPSIRWKNHRKGENKLINKIIGFTLFEILRYTYTYKYLTNLHGLTAITGTKTPKILSSPPELLTLLEQTIDPATKGKIIIYPDPPLTSEEMNLLGEVSEDYKYLTPILLSAFSITKIPD